MLISLDAFATTVFLLNQIPHAARRSARANQLLLKIDKDEFEEGGQTDIRRLLSIRACSQKN